MFLSVYFMMQTGIVGLIVVNIVKLIHNVSFLLDGASISISVSLGFMM